MDSFEFESGAVLENVCVEYLTTGIPKYDEEGKIINMIVYCPTFTGGHSILAGFDNLIGKYGFDENEYFFIWIVSLGNPNSCSPSSTGLKYNFPQYTFRDRINFKKQFLKEKFNVTNVFGILGEGLGGFEIFSWASEYPDDMGFIIIFNPFYKLSTYRYVFVKCIESIIDSSEDFYSEEYSSSLSKLSVAIFRLMFADYIPKKIFKDLSNDEIDVLMEDYVDEGLFMDIHDFKFRNDSILNFDIEDKLHNIKAKSMFLTTSSYLLSCYENDLEPLEDLIEDSKILVFDNEIERYSYEKINPEIGLELLSFLEQFKK